MAFRKILNLILIPSFLAMSLYIPGAQAGEMVVPVMPAPGTMVALSPAFVPAQLQGLTIHPDNALQFDFLMNKGDGNLDAQQKQQEYTKLIKYFMASLTVPDKDQWVNLSPYEKDRIVPADFGKTEMGRDLLAQDYLLKQITSSLMYPESGLGKTFWDKVYANVSPSGTAALPPVNTFNKVWIVPDEAVLYESGNSVFILKSHLKVMLDEDYLASQKNSRPATSDATAKIIREIILPQLEHEVNTGKNFAMLRQVFSGMILATWYKKALKESLLGKIYADKSKVKGVDQKDVNNNQAIYEQYLAAFKKGVYNYIKDEYDPNAKQPMPRKYFAGGVGKGNLDLAMQVVHKDSAFLHKGLVDQFEGRLEGKPLERIVAVLQSRDEAMSISTPFLISDGTKDIVAEAGKAIKALEEVKVSDFRSLIEKLDSNIALARQNMSPDKRDDEAFAKAFEDAVNALMIDLDFRIIVSEPYTGQATRDLHSGQHKYHGVAIVEKVLGGYKIIEKNFEDFLKRVVAKINDRYAIRKNGNPYSKEVADGIWDAFQGAGRAVSELTRSDGARRHLEGQLEKIVSTASATAKGQDELFFKYFVQGINAFFATTYRIFIFKPSKDTFQRVAQHIIFSKDRQGHYQLNKDQIPQYITELVQLISQRFALPSEDDRDKPLIQRVVEGFTAASFTEMVQEKINSLNPNASGAKGEQLTVYHPAKTSSSEIGALVTEAGFKKLRQALADDLSKYNTAKGVALRIFQYFTVDEKTLPASPTEQPKGRKILATRPSSQEPIPRVFDVNIKVGPQKDPDDIFYRLAVAYTEDPQRGKITIHANRNQDLGSNVRGFAVGHIVNWVMKETTREALVKMVFDGLKPQFMFFPLPGKLEQRGSIRYGIVLVPEIHASIDERGLTIRVGQDSLTVDTEGWDNTWVNEVRKFLEKFVPGIPEPEGKNARQLLLGNTTISLEKFDAPSIGRLQASIRSAIGEKLKTDLMNQAMATPPPKTLAKSIQESIDLIRNNKDSSSVGGLDTALTAVAVLVNFRDLPEAVKSKVLGPIEKQLAAFSLQAVEPDYFRLQGEILRMGLGLGNRRGVTASAQEIQKRLMLDENEYEELVSKALHNVRAISKPEKPYDLLVRDTWHLLKKFGLLDDVHQRAARRIVRGLLSVSDNGDLIFKSLPKDDTPRFEQGATGTDGAMLDDELGGIDMNGGNFQMHIKRDGKGMPLPLPQQDMGMLKGIEGFEPAIIEISPFSTLPLLSELKQKSRNPPSLASAS